MKIKLANIFFKGQFNLMKDCEFKTAKKHKKRWVKNAPSTVTKNYIRLNFLEQGMKLTYL